ncbi:hemolysin III family protein [Xylella fastidiosa subsp. morus]|jgi:hemolysin III|uniref:Hemolysin III protein n=4 Tax=Xylella fastidiosa TaxID=2371 RepID=Q87F02_XYLFT|nr:hemolysin III family protein [Xylella fastidiosa]ADN63135.1 hemolysin III family channel protein [Xylella fastidiosa subsp. fastidiosa GB514]KAF0571778.1 hemolysin D [Xylella fastidiosa subsp. fastidiosa Mus-1]AAO28037.1 hemolysin III protein [Xylella fastidiosa Temecula1]ACB91588.1 channel protein, hemolysin III family [Xylella fastidiosa M23]AIC13250.1 hemolysin D [Xylella fastidiosa MUL0034]
MNANAHSSIDSRDELASAIIHGLGALATLAAGSVLITLVSIYGDRWQLLTSIVFSTTLFLLYVASTLYHAIPHPGAKARLRVFDHCAIYLLIAGTYTPFTLITLRGPWGWGLFATIWTLALSGVVFKLFFTERFRLLSTIVYVVMGWLVVIALGPLQRLLDGWTLRWLLAGGVLYTLGTYFYHRDEVRYFHAIWHVFVLAGSVCHFIAVTAQVL